MKTIVFFRHGEAYKNLKDIYGGNGSSLTEKGKKQIEDLGRDIALLTIRYNKKPKITLSCKREHVIDSGKVLADVLQISQFNFNPNYRPIKLGVFDSLSRKEQEMLYPQAIIGTKKWEKGEIDISEAEDDVPGMEKAKDYFSSMKTFVENLDEQYLHILIGTRSDMSCLLNIFKGNNPNVKMSYKYYPFDYAQAMIAVENSNKTYDIFMRMSSKNIILQEGVEKDGK